MLPQCLCLLWGEGGHYTLGNLLHLLLNSYLRCWVVLVLGLPKTEGGKGSGRLCNQTSSDHPPEYGGINFCCASYGVHASACGFLELWQTLRVQL